ncbi:MAG: tryptophan synthase, beta chain [Candidatus Taylorbacteria bacterium]|nr:tryptophan synthase, beta chain [Candidatus Taylorbacteria bacterium]
MKKNVNKGFFGEYGGAYVPEMLTAPLQELSDAFDKAMRSKEFKDEFRSMLKDFSGRPTPLILAANLTKKLGGAKIYLKNEGANHTGAHKITHCIGQALIAKRLGKDKLIAETGAGQHGVATATVAAKFGFKCKVFMGSTDMRRQRPNVFFMERLGAEVVPVDYGSKTLKDAVNEAMKYWMNNIEGCHYVLGSVLGPHPYPTMNREFQSIVGKEIKAELLKREGKGPDAIVACVGGGSNAIGAFAEFIPDEKVVLIGVEAGGTGRKKGFNASRSEFGKLGIFQGYKSLVIQDEDGQIAPTHSVAAGLDYPGLGPELADLYERKRLGLVSATDVEAIDAFSMLCKLEGIIPALESSHALAHAMRLAPKMRKDQLLVVNISGRGDKDIFNIARALKDEKFGDFLKEEITNY